MFEICKKKQKRPKMIKIDNIDKHKNIDGYLNKLTVIINNKINLVRTIIIRSIDSIMCDIKNKSNMVNEKIHKASEIDNDTLHLIDDNVNEIKTYIIKRKKSSTEKLETISDCQANCYKASRKIFYTIKYKGAPSEDITAIKTKTKDIDKTKTKTKDIDKIIPKTKDMDKIILKT